MATGIATQVSARNQISGTITNVHTGTAMSVVTVSANGHTIVSAITNQAVQELGLKKNDSVIALVKATEAIIAKGDAGAMKVSARNKVSGRVTDIRKGPARASVSVDAGELKFTTAITSVAVDELQLKQGDQVTTIFKATEVMLQKA